MLLGEFVQTCKRREALLEFMEGSAYLLEDRYLFSLTDLVAACQGRLLPFLYKVMEQYLTHITKDCQVNGLHQQVTNC